MTYDPIDTGAGDNQADRAVTLESLVSTRLVQREDADGTTYYDPSDYADAGAALQQAANDIPTTGGALVWPCRRLTTSDEIILPADAQKAVSLRGFGTAGMEEGQSGAIIESTIADNAKYVITYPDALFGSHKGDGSYIRDITIVGSGNEAGGIRQPRLDDNGGAENVGVEFVGGVGFESRSATNTFKQIGIFGTGSHGLVVPNGALYQTYKNLSIEEAGGDSIQVSGSHITIKLAEFDAADRHGASVYGENISIEQAELNIPGNVGINISAADVVGISKCHFKECPTAGIRISGSGVRLTDSVFSSDQAGPHIQLYGAADRVVIKGCTFRGTAQKYQIDPLATDVYIDDPTVNGEQGVVPGSATYTASFDTAFSHIPRLDVAAEGAGFTGYSNVTTDTNGNINGLDLTFDATPAQLDWEAIPRNVGV